MRGASHIILGLSAAVGLQQLYPYLPHPLHDPGGAALAMGAAVLGTLLPDVDSATSTIRTASGTGARPDWTARRVLAALGLRRGLVFWLLYGPLLVVFSVLGCFAWIGVRTIAGGHRGRTHTLLAIALLLGLALYLGRPPWALAFIAAYAAHLLADSLTRSGIPLLWPLTARRVHLLPFGIKVTTGSWVEYVIVTPVALAGAHAAYLYLVA